jgi:hypothetical protein
MHRAAVLDCFEVTKGRHFPQWDSACQWKVIFGTRTQLRGNTGYCDAKTKTIYLDSSVCAFVDVFVSVFLIHEICHAVANSGHDLAWAREMEAAARLATDDELADNIRVEIDSYCGRAIFQQATGLDRPNYLTG